MKSSQAEYEAFMQKVHDWEKQKTDNPAGRVKSKTADTKAIGRNPDSFQTKECLGYFWPQCRLKKHGKDSRGSRTCRGTCTRACPSGASC